VTYAGFWPRFAALLLDLLVMSPLIILVWWGQEHFRLFDVYYFLPGTLFGLWYGVYLVRRFGGTPGKRLMKLRIVKVGGESVTYREALLRYLPEWVMGIGTSLAGIVAVLSLTDAQYFAATAFIDRQPRSFPVFVPLRLRFFPSASPRGLTLQPRARAPRVWTRRWLRALFQKDSAWKLSC
jgi:uncharacterized RDD family membrane protein YckC